MRNIQARELKIKFVEVLNIFHGFSYEEGNPFMINIDGYQFFVFLKNTRLNLYLFSFLKDAFITMNLARLIKLSFLLSLRII